MSHTWKSGSHLCRSDLEKKGDTLGKWVTCTNRLNLEKCVTPRKVGHTWKNQSHLDKRITLGKISYTWNNR